MNSNKRMIPAVLAHVGIFFLTQVLLMVVLSFLYRMPVTWPGLFILISVPLHLGLAGFLIVLRKAFFYLSDGRPMEDIGTANRITMFRISATPTIMVLIVLFKDEPALLPWIIGLTMLAFASDFVDGWISRTYGEASRMGQYLDSSSDYIVLMMIGASFVWYQLIDTWFFVLILVRYAIQWLLVGILFFSGRRGSEVRATLLGKASVFATMTVMGLAVVQLVPALASPDGSYSDFIFYLELGCTVFLALSLVEKILVFVKGVSRKLGPEDAEADED